MHIRHAVPADLPAMEEIYAEARAYMAAHGNPTQWGTALPKREWLEADMARGESYVCVKDGQVVATFMLSTAGEPTYAYIEDGQWPDEEPYGVIHRIATGGERKGAGAFCIRWCLEQCGNVRIDTHDDNRPMQALLDKLGFAYSGRIYVEDGTPRRAYCKRRD